MSSSSESIFLHTHFTESRFHGGDLSLTLVHALIQAVSLPDSVVTITVGDGYCDNATSKIIQFAQTPNLEGVGKALSLSL